MSERPTIVVAGAGDVRGGTSTQAVRMALALHGLGCRILYVECGSVGGRAPGAPRIGASFGRMAEHPERPGLFFTRASRLPLFPLSFPEFVRRRNCARTSRRIARFLEATGAEALLVLHYGWYFPELLEAWPGEATHVYECLDDHARAPNVAGSRWKREYIRAVERRLFERAGLSVFSSPVLMKMHAAPNSRVLPLGVDARHFASSAAADPHEKLGIGRPRVGFAGLVTARQDWEMVRAAAARTPEWSWVIVGPMGGVRAAGPGNLHWIGRVRYDDLSSWTRSWDVGIVPMTQSDFNMRSWPLKFFEYFASGLAVASTPIPAASAIKKEAPSLVHVADDSTPEAFVRAAREALAASESAANEGPALAGRHSWENRARMLLDLALKGQRS